MSIHRIGPGSEHVRAVIADLGILGSGTLDLQQLACQLIGTVDQLVKVSQYEATRREEIRAWESTELAKLEAQRAILLEGLRRTFDERRETFDALFSALDKALIAKDIELASRVLDKVTDLAKSSPFKELASVEWVTSAWTNPERTWKF
ncbi:MAG TPA: hypothetical protein VFC82_03730 [Actinomycetaceae bacterium]|nr:hypothetical protein [Actinomycetaceae bacterium]